MPRLSNESHSSFATSRTFGSSSGIPPAVAMWSSSWPRIQSLPGSDTCRLPYEIEGPSACADDAHFVTEGGEFDRHGRSCGSHRVALDRCAHGIDELAARAGDTAAEHHDVRLEHVHQVGDGDGE